MTNFEKIKSLSKEEFLKFITKCFDAFPCDLVKGECANRSCKEEYCSREMDKWLDKEDEGNVDEWIKDYSLKNSNNLENDDLSDDDLNNENIDFNDYFEKLVNEAMTNREIYLRKLSEISNEELSKFMYSQIVDCFENSVIDIEVCPVGKNKCLNKLSCRENIEIWLEMNKDDKRNISEYLKDKRNKDQEMG